MARRRFQPPRWLRDNGLSIVLAGFFALFLFGQSLTGQRAYNEEQREHGRPPVDYGEYIRSSHFAEATFENFESEFLQMAAYVLLTVFLFQRGSAESNDPDEPEEERPSPRRGIRQRLYEHSLTIAFTALFALSFIGHAVSGAAHYNEEQHVHGEATVTVLEYLRTAQFWFESFQNWQSEFLAIFAMVVLTIFLRQRGSPESKKVEDAHSKTGK